MHRSVTEVRRAVGNRSFACRMIVAVSVAAALILVLLLLWYAVDVLLLAFAAILLAVFLRGLSDTVSRRTRLPPGWSLTLVILALLALIGASTWFLAPRVATQVDDLTESVPRAMRQLQGRLEQYAWGRRVLAQVSGSGDALVQRADVLARTTGVFSTTMSFAVNLLIILAVGIYLAMEPKLYRDGLVRLVPRDKRARAAEILDKLGALLWRWLVGRMVLMVSIGVLTAIGLWLLDIPLALTLGLLMGILSFIPNIGPLIAGIPAVAFAFTQSPTQALYVIILYLVLQTIDGYITTPLVQKRTVELPPALTIMAQVLFGVLLGGLGLTLATPLTAAALVLVKNLYIEDTLGDSVAVDKYLSKNSAVCSAEARTQ